MAILVVTSVAGTACLVVGAISLWKAMEYAPSHRPFWGVVAVDFDLIITHFWINIPGIPAEHEVLYHNEWWAEREVEWESAGRFSRWQHWELRKVRPMGGVGGTGKTISTWIDVPLWPLGGALLVYPGIAFIRGALRRSRAAGAGVCRKCGYDLTGNTSGVCPECGNRFG